MTPRGPGARRLRVAVFGQGHMGRLHARKLSERSNIDVIVIDPAQGHPAPANLRIDAAVIATPTATHVQVAGELLAAGTPCLVEKPLAATPEDAAALAGMPGLCVGHIERFNPALAAVAHVRPRFIQAERLAPFPALGRRTGARGTDTDVVADLMIHDLDLCLSLLGGPATDVRAVGVGVLTGGFDIANVRLELPGGVATLTASRVSREPVRKLRLVTDGTYWSVDLHARTALRVDWGNGELAGTPVPIPPGDPLTREHDAFLATVLDGVPFPVDGAAAMRAMRAVQQVRKALQKG